MAVMAVAVLALVPTVVALVVTIAALVVTVAALVVRRLTARLTFARVALITLEMMVAATATATAAIGPVGVEVALAGGFGLDFRLWRLGRRAAKELLHPGENAAGFFRFRRRRGGRRFALQSAVIGESRWLRRVCARLARFERTVVAAVALGAEVRPFASPILAPRTLATELGLCRSAWLAAARLAGDATERFAFPTLFNMLRRFGRKNLQLGPRLGGGRFGGR
jgi:hypothetical protein